MANDDENQPCSSRTTRNSRKKALSVSWVPLDIMFHNLNEHLPFSNVIAPARNTPQGHKTLSYFKLFLTSKIIDDIVLESNRYRNQIIAKVFEENMEFHRERRNFSIYKAWFPR